MDKNDCEECNEPADEGAEHCRGEREMKIFSGQRSDAEVHCEQGEQIENHGTPDIKEHLKSKLRKHCKQPEPNR